MAEPNKPDADASKGVSDAHRNAEGPMRSPREITLRRSKIKVVYDEDFSTPAAIAAQKAAGKNSSMFTLYLAQRIATFDGKVLTMGDIQEKVRGKDFLQLTGEILGDGNDDEGDEGNA